MCGFPVTGRRYGLDIAGYRDIGFGGAPRGVGFPGTGPELDDDRREMVEHYEQHGARRE